MKWSFVTIVAAVLLFPIALNAQKSKRKPKNSDGQGTLFASFGLNKSWFGKSDIHFAGSGYDFTLSGVRATDDFPNFSTPQISTQVGYYVKKHYALTIGFGQMKYILSDNNSVAISGKINAGIDNVTNLSGTYLNQPVTLSSSQFHYQNVGLSYFSIGGIRTDILYKSPNDGEFILSSNVGVSFGGLHSKTDFLFGGKQNSDVNSTSGFLANASAGLRIEFFRNFYIQPTFYGGYLKQVNAHTSENEASAVVSHGLFYSSFDFSVGMLLYIRPTNDCNSCPHW